MAVFQVDLCQVAGYTLCNMHSQVVADDWVGGWLHCHGAKYGLVYTFGACFPVSTFWRSCARAREIGLTLLVDWVSYWFLPETSKTATLGLSTTRQGGKSHGR